MKITAYNEQHHLALSGTTATTAYSYAQSGTALGSNTPLIESGAGTPGSGPQAAAWDHVHPEFGGSSNAELNIEGGQSVIFAHGSMGATETFDPTDGNVHTGTLTANCTVTLNAPTGTGAASLVLWLTEDGTGGWTVTWPGSVVEEGTHDTTAGTTSRVILETVDGGTNWIATWVGVGSSVAALDDLTDVTITTPVAGDRLRYSGSEWVNSPALWVPVMVEDGATGLWYVVVTGDGDAVMTEVP